MFSENMEIVKKTFEEYKGSGMYIALFLVCILYIFLREKDKNIKTILGYFSVVMLFMIMNPIFNKAVNAFINVNTYWRLFWTLPVGITIAYVAVKVIQQQEKKYEQILVFISIIFIIISSGKFIYNEENYIKIDNWYKVPQEAREIADIIGKDENNSHKIVMLPDTLVPYIRQVDASIELAYGRQPAGYHNNQVLQQLNAGNVKYVTDICKEKNWNYIIFSKETPLTISPEYFGYKLFAQTENYDIYKLNEI